MPLRAVGADPAPRREESFVLMRSPPAGRPMAEGKHVSSIGKVVGRLEEIAENRDKIAVNGLL